MTLDTVLKELESLGTAQNIKVYRRHGAGENLYGVSFGNLRKLEKKYKGDTDLAIKLWDTENVDAQTLAILIADSNTIAKSQLIEWQRSISYYLLSDLFADLVSKTKFANQLLTKWLKAKDEYTLATAYSLISSMLKNQIELDNSFLEDTIENIEKDIQNSQNRTKHSMNMTLIAIAIYRKELESRVIEVAETIGKVEVDHGETGCKTPEIIPYIKRARQRDLKRSKAKKK